MEWGAGKLVRFARPFAVFGILSGGAVVAQPVQTSSPAQREDIAGEQTPDVIVRGDRRSIAGTLDPLATLDSAMISATGAATIEELLRTIRGLTQSADGSDPIFLLNGQRTSGYTEIGTLPPEAIEKVEVMPEQAALKFGYPPTHRVLNFITKRRFQQTEARATAGTATRGGGGTETANLGLTRLRNDGRLTLALEYRHTDRIPQSDRDIAPDPDILFDAVGNVVGTNGTEIDPALSAAAGRIVTVAPVPAAIADRASLAAYATGANAPRAFDLGPYRTLAPHKDALKAETVLGGRVGKTMTGSFTLSAERSIERSLAGPAAVTLLVPGGTAFSPFSGPVLLNRYLTEADPLRQRQTTTTLHAGSTLRGALLGWRWDLTTALDQQQIGGFSERSIDLTAANAAIANGANPFLPLDAALLSDRLVDVARQRTRTGGAKAVFTNTPFRVPAGEVSVTASAEFERATADSFTRGPNPFELHLGRTRIEGSGAIDIPIASKREDVLPFVGELSINGSANARDVSGFGTLYDTTYGATWGPVSGVQLLATARHSASAPAVMQQASPEFRLPNVPVFDSTFGRTELVTLIVGGNADLVAEHRRVQSLTLNVKPFKARELRVTATYSATTIRNQTATVYALTPQTEAELPGLVTRDALGRLVTVAYRPINIYRETQRTLNLTLSSYGQIGRAPPPAAPGTAPKPDTRPNFYAGAGPTLKLSDRLQLKPGTTELDLLRGDTIIGNGTARVSGYVYGGINYLGHGLTFDAWYSAANRARSPNPAADLRFSSILKANIGGTISLERILKREDWAKKLQLKLDVNNVTDARPRVRDGNGDLPNRFQRDYLDPIGRMVTLSLRKLF